MPWGGTDARAFVKAGATIAIPWIALLLLVRQLASAKVSASAFGLFEQPSSVAPSFGETIFFAGALAALARAAGGALAWGEGRSREAATLGRAFGRIDRPSAASRPYAPPSGAGALHSRTCRRRVLVSPHRCTRRGRTRHHRRMWPQRGRRMPPPERLPLAPPSPAPDAPGQATMVHSTPLPSGRSRWSFCDGCGHPVQPTDRFCESCGRSVPTASS